MTNHSFLLHATQHLLITAKDKSASAGRTPRPGARGPQPGLISGQICLFRIIANIWILKIRASEKRRADFTALKRRGREDISVSQKGRRCGRELAQSCGKQRSGDVAAVFQRPQENSSPVRACVRARSSSLVSAGPAGPGSTSHPHLDVFMNYCLNEAAQILKYQTSSNKGPTLQSGFVNTVFQCAKNLRYSCSTSLSRLFCQVPPVCMQCFINSIFLHS